MTKPRVRVIIPVFNGAEFIAVAIDSVKSQTFKNWELYIVDDGSTDNTFEIAKKYCDEKIRVIQQTNQGDESARIKAMENAQTDYIARLDADDMMLPDRLEKQVAFMDSHENVGLLGGQIVYVSEDGKTTGFRSWWPCEHSEILRLLLARRGAICNPTLMVRQNINKKLSWPGPGLPGRDLGYVLEISRLSRIANISDVVNLMRIHKNSIQSRKDQKRRVMLEGFYIDRYLREEKELPLINWIEYELKNQKQNILVRLMNWWELKIGKNVRKGMWLWLNRKPKALSWPWFILSALMAPQRNVTRILRILRAN